MRRADLLTTSASFVSGANPPQSAFHDRVSQVVRWYKGHYGV